MCGICGFNWEDRTLLENMKEMIAHRGPDGEGSFVGGGASLGHRRLSIIDLSERGRQPMTNGEGIWVSYNGEIYNFPELRKDLEACGYTFRSDCDTEVILHAYSKYGVDFPKYLVGMFAIALFDERAGEWILTRDRLGIKPLYYYYKNGNFVFASEIKAILQAPCVEKKVDAQAFFELMGYEYVPGPSTLFENISKLEPGSTLVLDHEGKLRIRKYWRLERKSVSSDPDAFYDLFQTVCQDHLLADVNIGAFLSGGLDSSSVICALQDRRRDIQTFALGYREASYSEFEEARYVADFFDTDHEEYLIEPVDYEVLERCVWHLDEPVTDPSNMPFMLICQTAARKTKVCLSGDGGDEVLMGYDRFLAHKAASYVSFLPRAMRKRLATTIVSRINDDDQKKSARNVISRFFEGLQHPDEAGTTRWQFFLKPEYQNCLFNPDFLNHISSEPLAKTIEAMSGVDGGNDKKNQYAELTMWLPDCVLMKVDKMSMAYGLEVRPPFLDHRLVECCFSLPERSKLRGLTTKWILREAMRNRLPERTLNRGKQGFSFPMKNWFRSEFADHSRSAIDDSRLIQELCNKDYINRLWAEHLEMSKNHSHVLWLLTNIGIWERHFLASGSKYSLGHN